jgi:hypothetical protein
MLPLLNLVNNVGSCCALAAEQYVYSLMDVGGRAVAEAAYSTATSIARSTTLHTTAADCAVAAQRTGSAARQYSIKHGATASMKVLLHLHPLGVH